MIIIKNNIFVRCFVSVIMITLLFSCNLQNDYYKKVKNINIGDEKDKVLIELGEPLKIYRKVYIKDTVVVFDYGTSVGASSNKAIIFDKDTISVIIISMGG